MVRTARLSPYFDVLADDPLGPLEDEFLRGGWPVSGGSHLESREEFNSA